MADRRPADVRQLVDGRLRGAAGRRRVGQRGDAGAAAGRRRHRGRLAPDVHRAARHVGAHHDRRAGPARRRRRRPAGVDRRRHRRRDDHPGAGRGRSTSGAPARTSPTGQLVLEAGARLGPGQIGLLAAVGRDRVVVRPRPRVVILSTGSELVEPGNTHRPGPDPRVELLHPHRRRPRGRRHRVPGRHRPRRRPVADERDRGPADPRRPGAHQRRRQRRRVRRGQGGAVAARARSPSRRSRCSPASRRASAPSAPTRRRSSRCRATR